jgi:hypothetical protein
LTSAQPSSLDEMMLTAWAARGKRARMSNRMAKSVSVDARRSRQSGSYISRMARLIRGPADRSRIKRFLLWTCLHSKLLGSNVKTKPLNVEERNTCCQRSFGSHSRILG